MAAEDRGPELTDAEVEEIAREVGLEASEVRGVIGPPSLPTVTTPSRTSPADHVANDPVGSLPVVPSPSSAAREDAGILDRHVQAWADRLIDRTKNNRLLYFDPAKPNAQAVVAPSAECVWDSIVGGGRTLEIWLPPLSPGGGSREADVESEERRIESSIELAELPRRCLLLGRRTVKQTRAFTARLDRKAREEMTERGLQVAFLAFGAVRWRDDGRGDEGVAPLILVPVSLGKENPSAPFTLTPGDDEPFLNPALRALASRTFRVDLPELGLPSDDDADARWPEVLDSYVRVLSGPGLQCEDGCWLGYFTFHKLVMFEDLCANAARASQSRLLRELAGKVDQLGDGPAAIRPDQVDGLFHPARAFQVRDADSSQQACIEMAKRGDDMVIIGPPGTGKSQTIANIIAELLGQGRSVLFVAEKMAALEVVQRRLTEDGLSDFCLELHSHKVQKRAVIDELARTLAKETDPETAVPAVELARWADLRNELNGYAKALHEKREPLGVCVFSVFGKLGRLHDVPSVPAQIERPDLLTPERLASYQELGRRVVASLPELIAGQAHPWHGYKLASPGLAALDVLRSEIREQQEQSEALRRDFDRLLLDLGLSAGETVDWNWLKKLVDLTDCSPGCDPRWLEGQDPADLLAEVRELGDGAARLAEGQRVLARSWQNGIMGVDWGWMQRWASAQARLADLGGKPVATELLVSWPRLARVVVEGPSAVEELDRAYADVRAALNLDCLPVLPEPGVAEGLAAVLEALQGVDRVESAWVDREGWERAERSWSEARARILAWRGASAELGKRWLPGILEADLASAHTGFSGPYLGVTRWFRPAFWRDRKMLLGLSREGRLPKSIGEDLRTARGLQAEMAAITAEIPRLAQILGERYQGLATDVETVERAVQRAQALRSLAVGHDWSAVARRAEQRRSEAHVGGLAARLQAALAGHVVFTGALADLWQAPPAALAKATELRALVRSLEDFVRDVSGLRQELVGFWRGQQTLGIADVARAFETRAGIERMQALFADKRTRLHTLFGPSHADPSADWAGLAVRLQWCVALSAHFGKQVPRTVVGRAARPPAAPRAGEVERLHVASQRIWTWLGAHFDLSVVKRSGRDALAMGCADVSAWMTELAAHVDDVAAWCGFRDLLPDLRRAGLAGWLEGVRAAKVPSEQIWSTLERSLYSAWYDAIAGRDGRLGHFDLRHHEDRIGTFRRLDRALKDWARSSLRGRLGAQRPSNVAFSPGGQLGLLKKEANKKRRQKPLRELFRLAPDVIRRLKPCLLMSPISVAQFLAPHAWTFDVVVFDEASQLCVEDAVGCLMRAKQAIVVGDPKQLAPTSFFKSADDDESGNEDDEIEDADYSSLIDVARARWRELGLRWHYRSRHQSLIAFSNNAFYDNDLIVFPSVQAVPSEMGVSLLHVPDGRYDRGKSATNRREAERVVDLVLEHFRRHGRNVSLGVIAFSLKQAHLIDDLLSERRRSGQEPELEQCFAQNGAAEPFFVKNLENVQGDERDVMLISVGYGRDSDGKLSYNFGPVNQRGGPNRLNVAVTRAKRRVVLVSSIRASDFDASRLNSDGVRLLRDYLAFAELGAEHSRERMGDSVGDFESDFERSVAGAIRELGYVPVPQVGCGRFRIDLGVLDSGDTSRYLLGVECDGAQYHSSPTARDRDRLRDEILEQHYGWRLFRIWGPDWVRNRGAVINRLRIALDQERQRPVSSPPGERPRVPTVTPSRAPASSVVSKRSPRDERFGFRYETLPLKTWSRPFEFHDEQALRDHVDTLGRLVDVEGPIHFEQALARIRGSWKLKRSGGRMFESLDRALAALVAVGKIEVRQEGEERFLWPVGRSPGLPRWPDDEGERRPLEWTAPEEIVAAIEGVVTETCGIAEEELMRAIARYFGWQQLTETMRPRLTRMIGEAVREGRIRRRGNELVTG